VYDTELAEFEDDDVLTNDELTALRKCYDAKARQHGVRMRIAQEALERDFDASYVGGDPDMSVSEDPMEVESGWAVLRAKLTGHYAVASAKNLVKWIF
jgi:hypothetical protein